MQTFRRAAGFDLVRMSGPSFVTVAVYVQPSRLSTNLHLEPRGLVSIQHSQVRVRQRLQTGDADECVKTAYSDDETHERSADESTSGKGHSDRAWPR